MKTPFDICKACIIGSKHPIITKGWHDGDGSRWRNACRNGLHPWKCPPAIKPGNFMTNYPPEKCPYRLELLLMKDDHEHPKTVQ